MPKKMRQRNNYGGSLAEFGPIIWVFFLLILFPLIDMASFVCGVTLVMFTANTAVHLAAPAPTFKLAQTAVDNAVAQLSSLTCLATIKPRPADSNGTKLVCLATNVTSSTGTPPTTYNVGATIPVDTANNTYQYCVTASYDILPIFNFAGIPFLGDIPGVGQAVPITFAATANVEHPEGLNN